AIIAESIKMLISATLSKTQSKKGSIKIKPITVNGREMYQVSWIENAQAFHKNYSYTALLDYITELFPGTYRQFVITTANYFVQCLEDKHGTVHVVKHANKTAGTSENVSAKPYSLNTNHNRKKHYMLKEGSVIPWLVDLGVMDKQGHVIRKYHDKFRQINRFLEFVDTVWPELYKHDPLRVVDFGCGKSYLTFAMHYYFTEIKKAQVEMIGLDLKQDVMTSCNVLAQRYGMNNLIFKTGDIAGFTELTQADLVVCLHACDTATDYAIQKAVTWNAKAILAVPCCHKELIHTIQAEPLTYMMKHGIIRERVGSLVTDTLRALALEAVGYTVTIMEFIATEHTPKNILIRAQKLSDFSESQKKIALERLYAFMEFWNVKPLIVRLLNIPEK
ncbi:MAG TPA: SAM-dependent methyltransferase, partial [Spirochaetales bacterium]|nr:SAM-dependent methyltransferase [Spirochaetales bacterium]